jgi:hypothetical protein
MATFRVCLMGSHAPLVVDLPATDAVQLAELSSSCRFIVGHMVEANEDGICPGIMIQTSRIQLATET